MDTPGPLAPLDGFRVAVTADRRAGEQAELLRRRGAEVVYAPTIATGYLGADRALVDATDAVVRRQPDVVVANTAIGMRAWIEAAQAHGRDDDLLAALRRATVVARGPKAASACHGLGIPVAHEAPDERLDGLLDHLVALGVRGKRVAFQRHGDAAPAFVAALRAAGADVLDVSVYRYGLPDDLVPAERLVDAIVDGRVDAVTFTSRPAIENLLAVAADRDAADDVVAAFNADVVAACIGPVCAEGAVALGVRAPLHPARGRLGMLVRALAERLGARATTVEVDGMPVVLQGTVCVVGGARVELARREADLLRVLARRPGAVVGRATLRNRVWQSSTDDHVVEVTVARLRRRLVGTALRIAAVPGRGYRLTAHSAAHAL